MQGTVEGASEAALAAVARRDAAGLATALRGATLSVAPLGWRSNDAGEIVAAFEQLFTAMPDLTVKTVRRFPGDDTTAVEILVTATLSAGNDVLPATGRAIASYGRAVFTGADGALATAAIYFDLDDALGQAGLRRADQDPASAPRSGRGGAGMSLALASDAWWNQERTLAAPPVATPAPAKPRRRRGVAAVLVLLLGAAGGAGYYYYDTQLRDDDTTVTSAAAPSVRPAPTPTATSRPSATPSQRRSPSVTPAPTLKANVAVPLSDTLLFERNSAVLKPEAEGVIADLADQLRSKQWTGTLTVTGYTDNLGSDARGLRLSRQRADAVAEVFRRDLKGAPIKVIADGRGEADPVAPNTSEENRAKNRRVEVEFTPRR